METVYTRALTQYVSHMVECEKAFDELSKRIEACARDCATNCGPPRSCNSQCHEGHHHENLNATKRTKRTADARTKLRTLRGDFAQFHPDIPHEAYVRAGLSISQWLQTGGTMEKWQVVRTAQWQRAAYAPGNWDDSKVPNSVRLEGLNADSFAFWALYARIRHRNAALLKAADYFKKKDHPLKDELRSTLIDAHRALMEDRQAVVDAAEKSPQGLNQELRTKLLSGIVPAPR